VVSHPHPDHFGGLGSVLTRIEVRELWDTGQGRAHGGGPAYSALLDIALDRGVAVKSPSDLCGRRQVGGAWLSVFGPCPAFSAERSPNDNSFVVQFAYQDASVLLVGDAEQEQERALLEKHGERLRSTVLKVGHHGSRTSSGSAFLRAVRPEFAVVSCGSRNRFGHPHPEAMSRLLEQGSKVWRVDERGSVSWAHPGSFARGWAWRKN